MEALPAGCQLDVMLLFEVVADPVMEVMFPVNTIRNMALLQVTAGRQPRRLVAVIHDAYTRVRMRQAAAAAARGSAAAAWLTCGG